MDFSALLTRGGVWHNVPGKDAIEHIEKLVAAIRLPATIKREDLVQACIRRESSSPTAMGRGVAFPHPGVTMTLSADEAFVAVSYPRFPVDWRAPDGAPVKAVFLIVSSSRNDHLTTLSTLAKLCGDAQFYAALMAGASMEQLASLIRSKTPK